MNKSIPDIYNLIQELSWHFGNHGFNGECCGDLSLVEFMALKKVYKNENYSIQEIGRALDFTKSGATKIINRLENKGYVIREHSSIDGRVCCVVITDKGLEAITSIEERYTDYVGEMLKDFEPNTIDNVKNVLELLITSVRKQGFIKSNQNNKGGECC